MEDVQIHICKGKRLLQIISLGKKIKFQANCLFTAFGIFVTIPKQPLQK